MKLSAKIAEVKDRAVQFSGGRWVQAEGPVSTMAPRWGQVSAPAQGSVWLGRVSVGPGSVSDVAETVWQSAGHSRAPMGRSHRGTRSRGLTPCHLAE